MTQGLQPPRLAPVLVERQELISRLREGRGQTLTLVCAPAGYGKTTLLAQWMQADNEETPFVWLSLEERDSDPVRWWMRLVGGLREVHESVGESSLAAVGAGPSAIAASALPALVDELAEAPPMVVVLDDWHVVRSTVCDDVLSSLLKDRPAQVQIVVSSRSDPGLPVARYRAHGTLVEVRERDLRMNSADAVQLFQAIDVELDSETSARLTERTEGWAAGLCLARLALRDHDDPPAFVEAFSGDSRHVVDFLLQDVLASVDRDLLAFLLRSSVLERFSAPMCDFVLERDDSATMLRAAEHANLFVVPLDAAGVEFRYHHLFTAVLRRELQAVDARAAPPLHARAADWYEAEGNLESAIPHAIASREVPRASDLIVAAAVPLLSTGRMATVERWFDQLDWAEALADRPLALVRALSARLSGRGRDDVERWLAIAERGSDLGPLVNGISSMRSAVAMVSATYLTRGIADGEASARFVLESEPEGSPWRYAGLVPLGQALYLAGRPEEARAPLEEARTLPGARRLASTAIGIAYLALVALEEGDRDECEFLARDALAVAEEIGHGVSAAAANPHLALGAALIESADLHGAVTHLERAVSLSGEERPSYWHAHAQLRLAHALHRVGDQSAAMNALAAARHELDELPDRGMLGELLGATAETLSNRPRREGYLGEDLSEAELKVLQGFLAGSSVTDVARELYLSQNTVKTHRRTIYRKLGVTTRDELVARAAELGLG